MINSGGTPALRIPTQAKSKFERANPHPNPPSPQRTRRSTKVLMDDECRGTPALRIPTQAESKFEGATLQSQPPLPQRTRRSTKVLMDDECRGDAGATNPQSTQKQLSLTYPA